jgi:hypothetical protein
MRMIYCWWTGRLQLWLYTLYDKNEASDLTPKERKALKKMLKAELDARNRK